MNDVASLEKHWGQGLTSQGCAVVHPLVSMPHASLVATSEENGIGIARRHAQSHETKEYGELASQALRRRSVQGSSIRRGEKGGHPARVRSCIVSLESRPMAQWTVFVKGNLCDSGEVRGVEDLEEFPCWLCAGHDWVVRAYHDRQKGVAGKDGCSLVLGDWPVVFVIAANEVGSTLIVIGVTGV